MAIIGWQGITVEVPADWEPGQFGGDHASGHVRVDSLEGPRLVVRWMSGQAVDEAYKREPTRAKGVERILNNYLKNLDKAERKRRSAITYNPNTHVLSKRHLGKKALQCYSWESQTERRCGHGLVWYCEGCHRTIIAEVTGTKKRDTEQEARKVLATLQDHPQNGLVLWAFFGLHFEVPERFELTGSTTMVGKIELRLRDGAERIVLQRLVANVVLEDRGFQDWVRKQAMAPMRQEFRVRHKEGRLHGHPAAYLEGRKRRVHETLVHWATRFAGRETAYFLRGRIWHCQPSNKIFSILACVKPSNLRLADEIADSAVCHTGGSSANAG